MVLCPQTFVHTVYFFQYGTTVKLCYKAKTSLHEGASEGLGNGLRCSKTVKTFVCF